MNEIEKLCDKYSNHPIVRSLVTLATGIPVAGVIIDSVDAGIQATISHMQKARLRAFFDELCAGEAELTEELIQSEDFLHAFFATLRAAERTRRNEKIHIFARLLKSAAHIQNVDEFEELLRILDALSVDDFRILLHAEKVQATQGPSRRLIAGDFVELGFTNDTLAARISRIAATGCMMELTESPTAWHEGKWDNFYNRYIHLTPLYFRIKTLIVDSHGNIL